MVYGIGKLNSAYRVMNIASSQMSMLNTLGTNTDMQRLHQLDLRNTLDLQKEKFNYHMLDKLDEMNKKIVEEKFKNK